MPRYKLTIEYDGTPFVGWQRQATGRAVQQVIEEAILAFSGEEVRIGGAGRTDTGVHALAQTAHLDLARDWSPDRIRDALNAHMRDDPVVILSAETVEPGFDARFSARSRQYLYRIVNRRAPPALDRERAWGVTRPLDADAMQRAARSLLGHHDFTTFRAARCQSKSPMKTLDRLDVRREGALVLVEAEARSFLHSQVRSMVGSLKLVGEGKRPEGWIAEILAARDRTACGPLAPPQGLYLTGVTY